MVSQKEIIEAFEQALNWANTQESDGYAEHWLDRKSGVTVNWSLIRQTIRRLKTEGIAPPDGHIIVPTCAVRKKPYVPMTDDEITEATQVMKPDLLHEPTLYCWRQVEKAVIKRAGLEIKHD